METTPLLLIAFLPGAARLALLALACVVNDKIILSIYVPRKLSKLEDNYSDLIVNWPFLRHTSPVLYFHNYTLRENVMKILFRLK